MLFCFQLSYGGDCKAKNRLPEDCECDDGTATCRGPIHTFPTDLPPNITHLYIIIEIVNKNEFKPVVMNLSKPFQQKMDHLEVIEIKLVDRSQYEHFTVKLDVDGVFFSNLPRLRVFRVKTKGRITFAARAFHSINTIQTLDFTRTRFLDLTTFIKSLDGLKQNPIRSLILKNMQSSIYSSHSTYKSDIDLSQIICPLVTSLKHLDFSHNDIMSLTMSKMGDCYAYVLDTLDLRYNLITAYNTDTNMISNYPMYNVLLIGVKVLHFDHIWSDNDADNNLWQDNKSIEEDNENMLENQNQDGQEPKGKAGVSLITKYMEDKISLSLIKEYMEDWVDEMKEHCPTMNAWPYCQSCLLLVGFENVLDDPCSLITCIFPNITQTCQRATYAHVLDIVSQVLREQCNLQHCFLNALHPLFSATEVYNHHISGRYSTFTGYSLIGPTNATTLCFMENNNGRVLDISFSEAYGVNQVHYDDYTKFQLEVTGLHKVQKVNLQSVRLPMRISPLLVSDMPSLEELHIGGNKLTDNENQALPTAYLHNKTSLKLLNLSHANLPEIEYNAFENSTQTRILDLSHNRFTTKTFLFDLSNTNMTQIMLNDNDLDSIRPEMQTQLDSLQNLELDLRNNPLRCDCTTMEFVQWAHQANQTDRIKFVDSDNYFCVHTVGGSTLFTVDLAAMRMECDAWRKTFLIVSTTLLSTSYYNSSSVCLCVCSLCTPRSFDGSSPNLVGVCRLTSHLPLRGSFSKRSTVRRVNGSLSLSTILYMCQPHSTRCNGTFCLPSSRV